MASDKKAPPKKRASSPVKGTRSSKRLMTKARKARPNVSEIPCQEGSALLNLPREIRNQIYLELLDGLDLTFRVDTLIIVATQDTEGYLGVRRLKRTKRGLPLWSLSSQQICYELLDMIARTYAFQPFGRPTSPENELPGLPNSLVFTPGGVRTVKLVPGYHAPEFWLENKDIFCDLTARFLKLMDNLLLEDARLEMIWYHVETEYYYRNYKSHNLARQWEEDWRERFRKVKITVVVRSDPEKGGTPLMIMDDAEKCAMRLVGMGGASSWDDLGRLDVWKPWTPHQPDLVWVRHVTTVARKVEENASRNST
ncbi:uncharacterized protein J4E84_007397 [Alternaria hordeiaustralica]|uniref:uncharacterized protein n=1 Tax=Alternaria hordeiaustralica TaxID=1187925 RepID=UPI0020C1C520|nr:uncharacterized protein J4E84_007397 [Alternaria hordeiaustralica]KAI4681801.1 hypothetical protein J4E84_007397 [Alternaria hordeiaustralica]